MFKKISDVLLFFFWLPLIPNGYEIAAQPAPDYVDDQKPNIVIIMADDLGFSDLGSYGSEIETPNLDKLANEGLRMTRFYNTARCSPSRASLLTGLYPQQAGVSILDNNYGLPNPEYQGYISEHAVTLAEALKEVGYRSYLSGKWHVGNEKGRWPLDRGFDKFYGLINGASNYYKNIDYRDSLQQRKQTFLLNDKPIDVPATTEQMWKKNKGFHLTDAFTDYGIEFLDEHDTEQPFFLYLAYTAPHWPLHAFPKDIDKYREKYEIGWDSLRTMRFKNQIALGITNPSTTLARTSEQVIPWTNADEKRKEEWPLEMALYAAMIDQMDRNIGRVIHQLKQMGQFKNTLIIFLSDNGGCHTTPEFDYLNGESGGPNSFPTYGYEGAEVSNVPFRKWKQFIHEGGISSPFIAYYPKMIASGTISNQPAHIIDIMPTILELTGAKYPDKYNGKTIKPMAGKSLVSVFKGQSMERDMPIFFEHVGNKGLIQDEWKVVAAKPDLTWELYNIQQDPTELNDLSESFPQIKETLIMRYNDWAKENNILAWPEFQELQQSDRD